MTSPATQEPCPNCDGTGKIHGANPCRACKGTGRAPPSQRAELLTREQLDPAAVMLRTGMAALEHARDLRVKVGVSELQAAALLQHIAALQSQLDTAQKDNLARHRQCGELRTKVAALTQRVEEAEAYATDRERHCALVAQGGEKLLERLAALTQRVEAADKLIDRCLELVRGDIEQFGPCDHSVGCCICGEVRLADDIAAYRALSQEPRNG